MSSNQTGLKANMKVEGQLPTNTTRGQETGEVLDFHSSSASFPDV